LCTERTAFPDPPDVHGPAIKYYSSRTPYIALLGFLDHHEPRLGHTIYTFKYLLSQHEFPSRRLLDGHLYSINKGLRSFIPTISLLFHLEEI
jgi:hypothetical protein